jgi:hypothetical protein
MRILVHTLIGLMVLTPPCGSAFATTVFRCAGNDGVVRYQDIPCQSGEEARRIEMTEPHVVAVPEHDDSSVVEPAEDEGPQDSPRQAPARSPVIFATLCKREDGSQYLSDSGRGERHAVPLGMLGIPRESLADAYAGRNGIGVSAPGLREIPSDHSRRGSLGALYTWVEDPCQRIDARQICRVLDGQITDTERRLRLAFSDTSDQVRSELESLRLRASSCQQ